MGSIIAGRRHRQVDTLTSTKFSEKIQIHEIWEKTEQPNWHDSLLKTLPDQDPAQTPWLDRWADIEPSQPPIVARWVDIIQVAPLSIIERKLQPIITPLGMLLVFFAIVLTLGTIEVLFRCTIYERQLRGRKRGQVDELGRGKLVQSSPIRDGAT
jgi:hypothetical protein